MTYKLGKLPPKQNARTLKLSTYLGERMPPPPPNKVWREYKVPPDAWGMYANDRIGDCTCAAIAHMLMLVTAHTGKMVVPTEDEVIKAYSAISGFDPVSGMNDNGAAITDVLEFWRSVGIAGHKILAWAQIDHTNIQQVKQAIWLFGGIDIGVNLPVSAMEQLDSGQSWNVLQNDGGIDGGHSIPNFGYGALGTNCITWGARQGMSWGWFRSYVDECYAVITEDWFDQTSGNTPSGFNLAQLEADLKAVAV